MKPTILVPVPSPAKNANLITSSNESRRAFLRKTGNAALISAMGYTFFQNSAHATCEGTCSHLIDASTGGFDWSAWSEGNFVSLDDCRAKAVFVCSPPTKPSKRLQVNFWAEGWVDGGSSGNVSTTSFEMWAEIPSVHNSNIDAQVPSVNDVWVSVCSTSSRVLTQKAVMGGTIWVYVDYVHYYNAHIAVTDYDPDGSDEFVALVGKVYIKKVTEGYEEGVNGPNPERYTMPNEYSSAEFFDIQMYAV